MKMTFNEIDQLLAHDFGLVKDPREWGSGQTYFFERVQWNPSESTRVVRVLRDASGNVMSMQLCLSSDNNNSVLMHSPFEKDAVRKAVAGEIAALKKWKELKQ